MREFSYPATCELWQGERRSHFQLFDTPTETAQFAEKWAGSLKGSLSEGFTGAEDLMAPMTAIRTFAQGDLSGVAASEKLLAKMEAFDIPTARKQWVNDVAGAIPDVQAYIAGTPMTMRRKARAMSTAAPIAVVVDTGAAQMISAEQINARGAAVLALVRILSAHRPVELWAGAGLDADSQTNASWTFCRIETAPLDLAHAAFILTHAATLRRVFWACACAHGFQGHSPYGQGQRHATEAITRQLIAPAFSHVQNLIVLPRLTYDAPEPVQWIRNQLKLHLDGFAAAA